MCVYLSALPRFLTNQSATWVSVHPVRNNFGTLLEAPSGGLRARPPNQRARSVPARLRAWANRVSKDTPMRLGGRAGRPDLGRTRDGGPGARTALSGSRQRARTPPALRAELRLGLVPAARPDTTCASRRTPTGPIPAARRDSPALRAPSRLGGARQRVGTPPALRAPSRLGGARQRVGTPPALRAESGDQLFRAHF